MKDTFIITRLLLNEQDAATLESEIARMATIHPRIAQLSRAEQQDVTIQHLLSLALAAARRANENLHPLKLTKTI